MATDYVINYENHGLMQWQVHQHWHESRGAYWVSGFDVTTLNASNLQLTQGVFADEDLRFTIAAINNTVIEIFYIGAGNRWEHSDGSASKYWYQQGTRVKYNLVGTGMTDLDAGKWVNYYIFATPMLGQSGAGLVAIAGQNVHATESAAKAANLSQLTLTGLPSKEWKPLYKCTIKADATFSEYIDLRSNTSLIGSSVVVNANYVLGPSSAVSGNIAIFNGTTGKVIQDCASTYLATTPNLKSDAEGDFKGPYALRWGTSGTPSGLTISLTIDTCEIVSSYLTHTYVVHEIGDSDTGISSNYSADSGYFSLWFVYKSTITTEPYILELTDTDSWICIGYINSSNILHLLVQGGSDFALNTLTPDTMYHLCLKWIRNGALVLYLNGSPICTTTSSRNYASYQMLWILNRQTNFETYIDALYLGTSIDEAMASLHDGQIQAKGFWDLTTQQSLDSKYIYGQWTPITSFSNSWVNYGGNYSDLAYKQIGSRVYLRGVIKDGTQNAIVCYVPLPKKYCRIAILDNTAIMFVEIYTNGSLWVYGTNNTFICFDGTYYDLD